LKWRFCEFWADFFLKICGIICISVPPTPNSGGLVPPMIYANATRMRPPGPSQASLKALLKWYGVVDSWHFPRIGYLPVTCRSEYDKYRNVKFSTTCPIIVRFVFTPISTINWLQVETYDTVSSECCNLQHCKIWWDSIAYVSARKLTLLSISFRWVCQNKTKWRRNFHRSWA